MSCDEVKRLNIDASRRTEYHNEKNCNKTKVPSMPSSYFGKVLSGISKGMFQDHTREISHNELWIYNYNRRSKFVFFKECLQRQFRLHSVSFIKIP